MNYACISHAILCYLGKYFASLVGVVSTCSFLLVKDLIEGSDLFLSRVEAACFEPWLVCLAYKG